MVKMAEYSTDLTCAQWQILEPMLRSKSRRGRPREHNRRAVVNAILYLLRTGCQWRLLPTSFPPWNAVYQVYYRWRKDGTWERVHNALCKRVRKAAGKTPTPSAGIIDSQSVKTTSVGGCDRGYDGGKKINGRKRHLIVDTLGLVIAVVVHSAGLQDQDGACLVLYSLRERLKRIKKIFADSAYGRSGLPEFVRDTLGFAIELVKRPRGTIGFEVQRKRWIVERTFAWLGHSRRLSKDYETNPQTSETMIQISMIHLMLKRLERAKTAI